MEARGKALLAAAAAEAKLAERVMVLDVQEHTPVTDFFVLASGTNRIQIKAITDAVEDALGAVGERPGRAEGRDGDRWVLLDFGDVVIHIFAPSERAYYDLERLWGDAAVVER
ncbi:MAG TPA: ribosome silencing factor [bacterium]|nr:ribosome silencing factor [bacterium]